jgi:hypothetical protein
MNIPDFNTKKELYDFLVKNRNTLEAQKKAELKRADAVISYPYFINSKGEVLKAEDMNDDDKGKEIKVKIVINTTNYLDSHNDVHLPGLWKKSLSENKALMHLQEHEMKFQNIISDGKDLKAYTSNISWLELGFAWPGISEALIFESTIKKERNEYMFEQYKKGYVKNHSVGMIYVKLIMAINDEDYGAEYEAWQKYYPEIINKSTVDDIGYFWAVKEAKLIEGSAVPRGSNTITPTLSIEQTKTQSPDSTDKKIEPVIETTQKNIDYNYLKTNFKL